MAEAEQILEQEEVDALLDAVASEQGETAVPAHSDKIISDHASNVQEYDFAAPGRIIHGYLPQLELVNERFSRAFRPQLFNMLRQYAELSTGTVKVYSFAEYMGSLSAPMSINLVRIRPLRGTALVVFEPKVIYTIVDSFFGGQGRPVHDDRQDFTSAEQRIIQILLEYALDSLKQAWSYIQSLEFEFLYSETNPQFASVMAANESDVMVVTKFSVKVRGEGGEIHVSLPYSMLEPLRARLTAAIQNSDLEPDKLFKSDLQQGMHDVEVEVRSQLTSVTISLEDLSNLRKGDVIPIDIPATVTLDVGDIPLYRGKHGNYQGNRAIQITERLHAGSIPTGKPQK